MKEHHLKRDDNQSLVMVRSLVKEHHLKRDDNQSLVMARSFSLPVLSCSLLYVTFSPTLVKEHHLKRDDNQSLVQENQLLI